MMTQAQSLKDILEREANVYHHPLLDGLDLAKCTSGSPEIKAYHAQKTDEQARRYRALLSAADEVSLEEFFAAVATKVEMANPIYHAEVMNLGNQFCRLADAMQRDLESQ